MSTLLIRNCRAIVTCDDGDRSMKTPISSARMVSSRPLAPPSPTKPTMCWTAATCYAIPAW